MSKRGNQQYRKVPTRAVQGRLLPKIRRQSKIPQSVLKKEGSQADFENGSYSFCNTFDPVIVPFASDQKQLQEPNKIVHKIYTEDERLRTMEARLQSLIPGDPIFVADKTLVTYLSFIVDHKAVLDSCAYLGIYCCCDCLTNPEMKNAKVKFTTCLYGVAKVTKTFVDRRGNRIFIKDTCIGVGLLIEDCGDTYKVFVGEV